MLKFTTEHRLKINKSNKGKKRAPRSEEWRKNLSNSLKGRKVWNKGKKGLQKAWNKKELSEKDIINLYLKQNNSSYKIADKFNVDVSVILRILNEHRITLKRAKYFLKGKQVSRSTKNKISKSNKGRKFSEETRRKISLVIKKHYEKNGFPEYRRKQISEFHRSLWKNKEYKNKLIKKHKEYIKNNPKELDRLKKMQFPGRITSIEKKMLEFLKTQFTEGKDSYFDKQDTTKKTFYRPDFQFPEQMIIIELDGYYKHFTKEGYKKDKVREYYLKKAGWKVYRFNFYDIDRKYKFDKLKDKIVGVIKQNVNNGCG